MTSPVRPCPKRAWMLPEARMPIDASSPGVFEASEFVGIVSGHHGVPRSGRLMIFDPARGRKEAEGVVQEIPGYGKKVEPIIKDRLVNGVWPQFLTPCPIDEN